MNLLRSFYLLALVAKTINNVQLTSESVTRRFRDVQGIHFLQGQTRTCRCSNQQVECQGPRGASESELIYIR